MIIAVLWIRDPKTEKKERGEKKFVKPEPFL
jgi:hypothetical protein